MGTTTSKNSTTTTRDLTILCSSDSSFAEKEAAFDRLLPQMVQPISEKQLLKACAEVEAERYPVLWPSPPPSATRLENSSQLAGRVRGLVFGAALGDAVGLATEFLTATQIADYYGTSSSSFQPSMQRLYPDTHRLSWIRGDWTDDTDQLILILQTLLHCLGSDDANNTKPKDNESNTTDGMMEKRIPRDFAQRLLDWKEHGFVALGDENGAGLGKTTLAVLRRQEFQSTSPHEAARIVWEKGGKKSAPNGALMRTAITGVPFFWDTSKTVELTRILCQITHADPRCVASCVFVATCVSLLLQGLDQPPSSSAKEEEGDIAAKKDESTSSIVLSINEIFDQALEAAEAQLVEQCKSLGLETTDQALEELRKYVALGRHGSLEELQLDEPRGIGYTYKCLSAAIWALTNAPGSNFTEIIQTLVAAGGDSDSNATVAGALLGCHYGFSQLPLEWIAQMPYASWLEAHVQKILFMLQCRA